MAILNSKRSLIAGILAAIGASVCCVGPLVLMTASSAFAADSQTAVLDVQNMSSAMCPVTDKKALQKVPGVGNAKVDFEHKTATVKFDPAKTNLAALAKATTDASYPSTLQK